MISIALLVCQKLSIQSSFVPFNIYTNFCLPVKSVNLCGKICQYLLINFIELSKLTIHHGPNIKFIFFFQLLVSHLGRFVGYYFSIRNLIGLDAQKLPLKLSAKQNVTCRSQLSRFSLCEASESAILPSLIQLSFSSLFGLLSAT